MHFEYVVQTAPRGLAEAFILGEKFIGGDTVALVLGDNVFYGRGFSETLHKARADVADKAGSTGDAVIFGYYVKDPTAYGVVEFSGGGDGLAKVLSIEEKPASPKSHYAVPGLYFYDNTVAARAKELRPSERGELEITALNNAYLADGRLTVEILGRGMAWLDTGTYDGLLEAGNFIATIQKRQGMYVACIEEIAFANGWITREHLLRLAGIYKTDYGDYLRFVADNAQKEVF
jgi:glucose-1-phosphate thymidylyltransferase